MIGSVVSVLAITVIALFNYIHINVKGKAEREYVMPEIKKVDLVVNKTLEWFKTRGYQRKILR